MKSRTVRPIKRQGQKKISGKKRKNRLGDTQPLRPVSINDNQSLSDTQPIRTSDIYPYTGVSQRRRLGQGVRIRSGYENYQRVIQKRRQVLQTPKPEPERKKARPIKKQKRSGLSRLIYNTRKAAAAEQYFDYDLLLVIIFLMCFGLIMLYSTSSYEAQMELGDDMYYFSKQAIIGVLGFAAMFLVSKIDYHVYGAFAGEIYVCSMILMILVQTPLGKTVNGARRWIRLPGGLTLQPAEITKIAVILFISYELCRLGKKAYTSEGITRVIVLGAAASGGVLFFTDNLSTAVIVMAITCILIFIIHPKTRPFVLIIAAAAILTVLLILILSVVATNTENFRIQRIISWLNPEATADTGSFQVMQGLYAIGSGGFFGKGLGNSTQKLGVIPEAQNDMILVVICEELGVFGAIIILVLFGFLLYRLMFIAKNAPDLYGSLIATGIFAHISLQVILNIGVVTGLLPTTGITLPFISYGGTAILFLLSEMGIALGISRRIRLEGE